MSEEKIQELYFDGGCTNNGQYNARAEAYVFDGEALHRYPVEGDQTNNRAELTGLLKALEMCEFGAIIYGDSAYALNLAAGTWKAKVNLDLVREVRKLRAEKQARLRYVPGECNPADPVKGRYYRPYKCS